MPPQFSMATNQNPKPATIKRRWDRQTGGGHNSPYQFAGRAAESPFGYSPLTALGYFRGKMPKGNRGNRGTRKFPPGGHSIEQFVENTGLDGEPGHSLVEPFALPPHRFDRSSYLPVCSRVQEGTPPRRPEPGCVMRAGTSAGPC
jgi:hypothetical protein